MIRSIVATTQEIDDIEFASHEIYEQIQRGLQLGSNSVGLLYSEAEVPIERLVAQLRDCLGFEILYTSPLATMNGEKGERLSSALTVLTSDDVRFAVERTEHITSENYAQELMDAAGRAQARLGEDGAKLALLFPPQMREITGDDYLAAIARALPDTPVFGGVISDNSEYGEEHTSCYVGRTRAALLAMGGALRPVFSVQHCITTTLDLRRSIEKSDGATVHQFGDGTLLDYLRMVGPVPEQTDVVLHYLSSPFLLDLGSEGDVDGVPIVRNLNTIDHQTGTGTFFGNMPQGAVATMSMLSRTDILHSCTKTMDVLKEKLADSGEYRYSLALFVSCCCRYWLLGNDVTQEAECLRAQLPASIALIGAYANGEYCPTSVRGQHYFNRFHNASLTICAI